MFLTSLDSILELLLLFLQISLISVFLIVTGIFTVLDAYGFMAVIQLKCLHPAQHRHSYMIPAHRDFFFPFCLTLSEDMYYLGEKMVLIYQLCLMIWSVPLVLLNATFECFQLPYAFISSLSSAAT